MVYKIKVDEIITKRSKPNNINNDEKLKLTMPSHGRDMYRGGC